MPYNEIPIILQDCFWWRTSANMSKNQGILEYSPSAESLSDFIEDHFITYNDGWDLIAVWAAIRWVVETHSIFQNLIKNFPKLHALLTLSSSQLLLALSFLSLFSGGKNTTYFVSTLWNYLEPPNMFWILHWVYYRVKNETRILFQSWWFSSVEL